MKKFLMLVALVTMFASFSMVANAQENTREDDCYIKQKCILDYMIYSSLESCEEGSEDGKMLWSIHEELPKFSGEELHMYYAELISNNIWEDIDDDGMITNRDILDHIIMKMIPKYDEGSYEAKELWFMHEEIKKFTEEEVNMYLNQLCNR